MSKQQRESIEKSLDYDKFVKKVFSEGDEKTAYLADFTRDDVVCQLSVDPAEHDTKGDWTELRCLDVSAYTHTPTLSSRSPKRTAPLHRPRRIMDSSASQCRKTARSAGTNWLKFQSARLLISA